MRAFDLGLRNAVSKSEVLTVQRPSRGVLAVRHEMSGKRGHDQRGRVVGAGSLHPRRDLVVQGGLVVGVHHQQQIDLVPLFAAPLPAAGRVLIDVPKGTRSMMLAARSKTFVEWDRKPVESLGFDTDGRKSRARERDIERRLLPAGDRTSVGDVRQQRVEPPPNRGAVVDLQEHVARKLQVRVTAEDHALDVVCLESVAGCFDVLVAVLERSEPAQPQSRRIVSFRKIEQPLPDLVVVVDVGDGERGIGLIPGVPYRHPRARPGLENRPVERPREADAAAPDHHDALIEILEEVIEVGLPAAVVVAEEHQALLLAAIDGREIEQRPVSEMDRVQAGKPARRDIGEDSAVEDVEEEQHRARHDGGEPAVLENHEAGHLVLDALVLELPDGAYFGFLRRCFGVSGFPRVSQRQNRYVPTMHGNSREQDAARAIETPDGKDEKAGNDQGQRTKTQEESPVARPRREMRLLIGEPRESLRVGLLRAWLCQKPVARGLTAGR